LMEVVLEQLESEDTSEHSRESRFNTSTDSHPPSPSSSANCDELTEDEELDYDSEGEEEGMDEDGEVEEPDAEPDEPSLPSPTDSNRATARETLRKILQLKLEQANAKRVEQGLPPVLVCQPELKPGGDSSSPAELIPPAPYFRKRTYKRRGKVNAAGLTFADFRRDYAPEWVKAVVDNKGRGTDRELVNKFIEKYPEAEQWFNIHSIWAIRQGITFVNLSGLPAKPRPPPRPRKNPYKRLPNLTEAKYQEIQAYQSLNPGATWSQVLNIFGVSKRQMTYMSAKLKKAAVAPDDSDLSSNEVAKLVVE